jgi:peptidoglycan/LPS O-acetylase OafA/YrhL
MVEQMKHYKHIDGLRALAVLPVILFHFGAASFSGGFAGVDVFFVISGYLITGIIHDGIRAGNFSLARFYERRARRILPALFATCLLSLIMALLLFMPEDFKSFSKSLEGVAGFASNFIFARNTGYFAESLSTKPLLHTWSLSVEEQFYMLFPPLLFGAEWLLTKQRAAGKVPHSTFFKNGGDYFLILSALILLSFAINVGFITTRPEKTFYLLPARAWELLTGGVLRLYLQNIRITPKLRELMGMVGLILLIGCYVILDRGTPFPGTAAIWPCLAALLLIWAGLGEGGAVARILSAKPLVLTGMISYGLYLYHWPVLVFARYFLGRAPNMLEVLPLWLLTAALSVLSYVFLEKPVRNGTLLVTKKTLYTFSGAGLALFGIMGFWGFHDGGFPERFSPAVLQYADSIKDTNWKWAGCIPKNPSNLNEKNICTIGDPKTKPDFLAWGDSHLDALEPALAAEAKKHSAFGWAVAYSGCPPFLGADRSDNYVDFSCPAIADTVLAIIKRNKIKTVLLVARWDMYALGWEKGSIETAREPFISYYGEKGKPAFAAAFAQTILKLQSLGVHVWIVKQPPPQLAHIPSALARAVYFHQNPESLQRPYADVEKRVAFANSIFAQIPKLSFIDPLPLFCPGQKSCLIAKDGYALYTDNNHLSVKGALWGQRILEPFFGFLAHTL